MISNHLYGLETEILALKPKSSHIKNTYTSEQVIETLKNKAYTSIRF